MEYDIQKASKTKFGSENDIRDKIDRESGDISINKVLTIVEKLFTIMETLKIFRRCYISIAS